MKKAEEGYSLAELIATVGITGIVFLGLMALIARGFSETAQFERLNEGWLEGTAASTQLNIMLKNVARLDPPEDLDAPNDKLYPGLSNLAGGSVPAACETAEDFEVLRMTTMSRRQPSERILRPWSSESAGRNGSAHELRISHVPNTSVFGTSVSPTELFLIDADLKAKRRYRVRTAEIRIDAANDPYDDLPKVDGSGAPRKFTYAAVMLDPVQTPQGAAVTAPPQTFIPDSVVFPSETSVVCVNKATRQLVQLLEPGPTSRTLIQVDRSMEVTRFKVEFSATRKNQRQDELVFYSNLRSAASRDCMNLIRFSLRMSHPNARGSETSTVAGGRLDLSRAVLLNNFTPNRPVNCP